MLFHLFHTKTPFLKHAPEVQLPRGAASNAEIICNAAECGCGIGEPGLSSLQASPLVEGNMLALHTSEPEFKCVMSHISHPLATAECFRGKHFISLVDLDKQAS